MFESSAQYPDSWYAASTLDRQRLRPPLREDGDVDVCVVGAGFTGLYTALELAEAGLSVRVLEASRVAWAASGRNGGQLILGFSCDMPPFEAALGAQRAKTIWQLVRDAAGDIRQLIQRHQIDCELVSGHVWTAVMPRRIKVLTDWQEEAARHWDYPHLQFIPKAELPGYVGSPRYVAGLLDSEGGHLHPLKYTLGLADACEAAGVSIHEQSRVLDYQREADGYRVRTGQATLRCRKLVLACNAYLDRLAPRLSARVLPVGTYMIATEPLSEALAQEILPQNHAVSDNQFVLDYFRLSADRRLLFGGKCTYSGRTPANLAERMRADMLRVFPQLQGVGISHCWGGHIDITVHRTPDFGGEQDLYWAQGFSGHGLIPTRVAGRVLAAAIRGDDTLLDLFRALPNPAFPGGDWLRVPLQAAGMAWYRLRDYL